MTGPELHVVRGGELASAVRRHPAGKARELRARLAAAEADAARTSTRSGRARLRAAAWLCAAGGRVHAGCRALAERIAP